MEAKLSKVKLSFEAQQIVRFIRDGQKITIDFLSIKSSNELFRANLVGTNHETQHLYLTDLGKTIEL